MDYNKRLARSIVRFFFLSQTNLPATPSPPRQRKPEETRGQTGMA
jgi:hypothetical protein